MISQAVEYSLRAAVCLAFHHGEAVTVQRIAELAKIPAPYLSKLMQGLVREGLVRSRRGLGGGFVLTRDPAEITIWDVVQAVDPIQRIHGCPLEIQTHGTLCPLHRRLDQAIGSIEQAFRASKLNELVGEQSETAPLCGTIVPLDLAERGSASDEPESEE